VSNWLILVSSGGRRENFSAVLEHDIQGRRSERPAQRMMRSKTAKRRITSTAAKIQGVCIENDHLNGMLRRLRDAVAGTRTTSFSSSQYSFIAISRVEGLQPSVGISALVFGCLRGGWTTGRPQKRFSPAGRWGGATDRGYF